MNLQESFSKIEHQKGFVSLLESCERGTLPNSNLIICENTKICSAVITHIAKKILSVGRLENCADFFTIRPSGTMLQISADQIRELREKIYLSPRSCPQKFVAIFSVERMHNAAANAFLKTLEEPPLDTVIFLTSAKLHAILPTISGRCAITRIASCHAHIESEEIRNWIANYSAWLALLFGDQRDSNNHTIMQMYSLLTQLETISNDLAKDCTDVENTDGEISGKREIYNELFLKIEIATSKFFETNLEYINLFAKIIRKLESKVSLVALNVNFMACVEAFLIEIFSDVLRVRA
ncbi:MAG: hypothetical protein LBR91_03385 [Puniceicoccales bacterium]|jgi:hypothetical protein|nr:hypothetical protein [Puniceicoccales bacterium]